ncbi:MAG: hypothetical protein IKS05_01310 [Oscillospiraceae bacterium]|nr:hypothetical protein [Oscillospiraceae bacterium]
MEPNYDPMGKSLMKITGVLMLIFGIFGILIYALGLAVVLGLSYATNNAFSLSKDLVGMAILLAGALVEFIAGILGVRSAKKPERTGKSRVIFGVLCLLLTLAGLVHIALRAAAPPWWQLSAGAVLGVVTPCVYLAALKKLSRK